MTIASGIDFYYLISVLRDYEKAVKYCKQVLPDENFLING